MISIISPLPLNHSVLSTTDRGIRRILRGFRHRVLLVRLLLGPPRGTTLLPLILVRFHVFRQVVAPHEPLPARGAGEPLLPRVRTKMTLQLVAPGEPFAAEQPVADERPLARVPSQMRLQMRGLPVHFAASRHVAHVLPLPVHTELATPIVRLAVRAPASYALPPARFPGGILQEVMVGGRREGPLIGGVVVVLGAWGEVVGRARRQRVMLHRRDQLRLRKLVVGRRVARPRVGRAARDTRHRVRRRRERLRNLAVARGGTSRRVPVGGLARLKVMTAQPGIVRLIVDGRTSVIDCGGLMDRHCKVWHGRHAWHRGHAHL